MSFSTFDISAAIFCIGAIFWFNTNVVLLGETEVVKINVKTTSYFSSLKDFNIGFIGIVIYFYILLQCFGVMSQSGS